MKSTTCSICNGAALPNVWGSWNKGSNGDIVCNGYNEKLDSCGCCHRVLVGEEAEAPRLDEVNRKICDECYEEHCQFHCAICEGCCDNDIEYYSALSKISLFSAFT